MLSSRLAVIRSDVASMSHSQLREMIKDLLDERDWFEKEVSNLRGLRDRLQLMLSKQEEKTPIHDRLDRLSDSWRRQDERITIIARSLERLELKMLSLQSVRTNPVSVDPPRVGAEPH